VGNIGEKGEINMFMEEAVAFAAALSSGSIIRRLGAGDATNVGLGVTEEEKQEEREKKEKKGQNEKGS
jgi:hypothetical protein